MSNKNIWHKFWAKKFAFLFEKLLLTCKILLLTCWLCYWFNWGWSCPRKSRLCNIGQFWIEWSNTVVRRINFGQRGLVWNLGNKHTIISKYLFAWPTSALHSSYFVAIATFHNVLVRSRRISTHCLHVVELLEPPKQIAVKFLIKRGLTDSFAKSLFTRMSLFQTLISI
jgi:hypothetical protein